tara:strand:+ start:117 stop:689 length:573 start_codon:yes stop_codon:yes gene_type:complete
MQYLKQIENVSYHINGKRLFDSLSWSISRNNFYHIQGDNGSGKTTLLRILLGITFPTQGRVINNINKFSSCFLGHKLPIKEYLTVRENIKLILKTNSVDDIKQTLQRLDLVRELDLTTSSLSFGQKKKLALLPSITEHHDLYVLDEPFVGLDSVTIDFLEEIFLSKTNHDSAVVFTSHIASKFQGEVIRL